MLMYYSTMVLKHRATVRDSSRRSGSRVWCWGARVCPKDGSCHKLEAAVALSVMAPRVALT